MRGARNIGMKLRAARLFSAQDAGVGSVWHLRHHAALSGREQRGPKVAGVQLKPTRVKFGAEGSVQHPEAI